MPVKIATEKKSQSLLPSEPFKREGKPSALKALIVAPPGWGKTEFVMSNPKCLLLACEEGHGATDGYKIRVTGWDDSEKYPVTERNPIPRGGFVQIVGALQKMEDDLPYDSVAIDTIDLLIRFLAEESLGRLKVKHLSELEFGRGWDLGQNTPFRNEINKLVKLGLNVLFITHEDKSEFKDKQGRVLNKKETTLPKGIFKQIYPMVDTILHGIFGKKLKSLPRRDRIFVTEGSEDMLAKNRFGLLPPAWLVNQEQDQRWVEFLELFKAENHESAIENLNRFGYDLESL